MTSNEEIYNLTKRYPKVCIQSGWTISAIAPKSKNVEQDYEEIDYEEIDYPELQAEMDEANLWNF